MKKRFLSGILALCLCMGLAVPPAQAWSGAQDGGELVVEYGWDSFDADDGGGYSGSGLTGTDKKFYDWLKADCAKIANGTENFSVFQYDDIQSLNIISKNGTLQNLDTKTVLFALLMDCPYELFWFNKVKGWAFEWTRNTQTGVVNSIRFKCPVIQDYALAGPEANTSYTYQTDPGKIQAVNAALKNAQAVVNQNSGKSDYDKLTAYRDYICAQVEYNNTAANTSNYPYSGPWQMIYVFDNNPNTNVVCEGYSKAFKYLCDLSTFTNPVECYLVSGYSTGDHMWNIVRISGKSYLVDVTGCDSSVRAKDALFLAGSSNATGKGCTIRMARYDMPDGSYYPETTASYTYKSETMSLYSSAILTLAPTSYTPAAQQPQQPQQPQTPTLNSLGVDFSAISVKKISGDSSDDTQFTLGSTGANVSALVLGSVDCGITRNTLETLKSELVELGVPNCSIYLMEVKLGVSEARNYVRQNPSYVHVAAETGNTYNNLFWKITRACDGQNATSATMPSVCVLNSACQPIYYASHNTFDKAALRTALKPYAGASFADVAANQFYAKAVNWAVSTGVTTGTSGNRFSPNQQCTHAEILTFLWRAAGKPKSAQYNVPSWISVPSKYSYAADAAAWASSKGMLDNLNSYGGLGAPCTRAQAMEYIWRAFGTPGTSGNRFSDVPSGAIYAKAVSWAVSSGISNGTSSTAFSPNTVCTRGHIVTFLHRAYVPSARLK